jgi:hypothetical protein
MWNVDLEGRKEVMPAAVKCKASSNKDKLTSQSRRQNPTTLRTRKGCMPRPIEPRAQSGSAVMEPYAAYALYLHALVGVMSADGLNCSEQWATDLRLCRILRQ